MHCFVFALAGNTGISCDGQNAVDMQNINDIQFSPATGLDPVSSSGSFNSLNDQPIVIASDIEACKQS